MRKTQTSQIRKPCADQDTNQYGCRPTVRDGQKPIKVPANEIAKSNRQCQINQSEHTSSRIIQ
jgi:hypothetical protein